MTRYFMPSCKLEAGFPYEMEKLKQYLAQRWGIKALLGCCHESRLEPKAEDEVVLLCHTCHAIMQESSKAGALTFAWELIAADESFAYPDYQGLTLVVQDCWLNREKLEAQKAVRTVLEKMQISVVELPSNFAKADFCGVVSQKAIPNINLELAPQRYDKALEQCHKPMEAEQRKLYLQEYVEALPQKQVVCYCNACYNGLKTGGAEVTHLLQLLFPKK